VINDTRVGYHPKNSKKKEDKTGTYYGYESPKLSDYFPLPMPAFMAQEFAQKVFERDAYFFAKSREWCIFLNEPSANPEAPKMVIDLPLMARMQSYLDEIS
jgi:hypothetical protein